MDEVKETKRKHKIADTPVLGPIVACVVMLLISEIVVGALFGAIIRLVTGLNNNTVTSIGAVLGGILAIVLFCVWFKGEFKGIYSGSLGDRRTRILFFAAIIVVLVAFIITYAMYGLKAPTFTSIATALMAGICEEATFRLAPISVAMRKEATDKNIWTVLIISTVLFGLIHAANVLAGQSVVGTVFQVLSVLGLGLFFGAIYLRTGNLIITMVFHTIYDILGLMQSGAQGAIVDNAGASTVDNIISIGMQVICAVLAVFIIVGQRDEIEKVWKERWNR